MIILPLVISSMPQGEARDYMAWLYREHHRLMFATAWKYFRDKHTVEDIVSDSCVALMKNIDTLRGLDRIKLRAYIVSAVKSASLDYIDKSQRRAKYVIHASDEAMRTVSDKTDVQQEVALRQEVADVWSAIAKLGYKEQRIMQLRYSQGLTDQEIARKLNLSEESIRKYVSRARAHIKAMLRAG